MKVIQKLFLLKEYVIYKLLKYFVFFMIDKKK